MRSDWKVARAECTPTPMQGSLEMEDGVDKGPAIDKPSRQVAASLEPYKRLVSGQVG